MDDALRVYLVFFFFVRHLLYFVFLLSFLSLSLFIGKICTEREKKKEKSYKNTTVIVYQKKDVKPLVFVLITLIDNIFLCICRKKTEKEE